MRLYSSIFLIAVLLVGALPVHSSASAPTTTPLTNADAITPEEWQQLRTARSAALQANPDLLTNHQKLIEKMRALDDKIDAAMIKTDPTIAPIIAKFEANRPRPHPLVTPPVPVMPSKK